MSSSSPFTPLDDWKWYLEFHLQLSLPSARLPNSCANYARGFARVCLCRPLVVGIVARMNFMSLHIMIRFWGRREERRQVAHIKWKLELVWFITLCTKKKKTKKINLMPSLEPGHWKCQLCTMTAPSISQLTPHGQLKTPLASMACCCCDCLLRYLWCACNCIVCVVCIVFCLFVCCGERVWKKGKGTSQWGRDSQLK